MRKIGFVFCLVLVFACNTEADKLSEEFNSKMDMAIEVHDDVMPKMGRIGNLINDLEKEMDSLNRPTYEAAMKDLQLGHDRMMNWMKTFGDNFSPQEIQNGLQTKNMDSIKLKLQLIEKNYIAAEEMKKLINSAIENAEALLK
jgi:hypothetical protein